MAKSAIVWWTREHRLIALNLYWKLPFGQYDKGNKLIVEVAQKMGRTPSSLAMKLSNFASLDPVHRARGVHGLKGASKEDRETWVEFNENVSTLGPESEQVLHDLFTSDNDCEVDFLERDRVRLERSRNWIAPTGSTESTATVKVRRGQQFFRQSILNAYGVCCCISGINVPRMLVASHIRPWRDFPNDRINPRNGLCLSSLHDAAFDSGLITVDEKRCMVLSHKLRGYFPQPVLELNFLPFEGKRIRVPNKVAEPDDTFLTYHREMIFCG